MRRVLVVMAGALLCVAVRGQSPVNEVGDEREPELRKELVKMVTEDQNVRGEFDRFRRARGLWGLNNEQAHAKMDADPQLRKVHLEGTGQAFGRRVVRGK